MVAIIITVIVGAVAFLPRTSNAVPLGDLDFCVSGTGKLYHTHATLRININGSNYPIPANVGANGCMRVIHTHGTDGELHIEPDEDKGRDYTLGDFLRIWGNSANNANQAIFNSTQIFTNRVDASHSLTVTVNDTPDPRFQAIPLPKTVGTTTTIVITYGPFAS